MSRTLIDDTMSKCCGKPVIVVSDDREGTSYYECSSCNKPTDEESIKSNNGVT